MDKIKIYAFPVLLSIVGWFIVNTLNQIRADLELVKADVKTLLAQSSVDKTRIDNLEREVYQKTAEKTASLPNMPRQSQQSVMNKEFIVVNEEKLKKLVSELKPA